MLKISLVLARPDRIVVAGVRDAEAFELSELSYMTFLREPDSR